VLYFFAIANVSCFMDRLGVQAIRGEHLALGGGACKWLVIGVDYQILWVQRNVDVKQLCYYWKQGYEFSSL
jgi:hypothetical protein